MKCGSTFVAISEDGFLSVKQLRRTNWHGDSSPVFCGYSTTNCISDPVAAPRTSVLRQSSCKQVTSHWNAISFPSQASWLWTESSFLLAWANFIAFPSFFSCCHITAEVAVADSRVRSSVQNVSKIIMPVLQPCVESIHMISHNLIKCLPFCYMKVKMNWDRIKVFELKTEVTQSSGVWSCVSLVSVTKGPSTYCVWSFWNFNFNLANPVVFQISSWKAWASPTGQSKK